MAHTDPAEFRRGIDLINRGEFFDAHEVLEDVWRAASESERKFFQGLVQVAVGFHHHSRGNLMGCRSLLERAHRNLSAYPAHHEGLDLAALRQLLTDWCEALDHGDALPSFPKLQLHV